MSEDFPLIKVKHNLITKIVYLGNPPKYRQVGDLWTPMHTLAFFLFVIGILGILVGIILEAVI